MKALAHWKLVWNIMLAAFLSLNRGLFGVNISVLIRGSNTEMPGSWQHWFRLDLLFVWSASCSHTPGSSTLRYWRIAYLKERLYSLTMRAVRCAAMCRGELNNFCALDFSVLKLSDFRCYIIDCQLIIKWSDFSVLKFATSVNFCELSWTGVGCVVKHHSFHHVTVSPRHGQTPGGGSSTSHGAERVSECHWAKIDGCRLGTYSLGKRGSWISTFWSTRIYRWKKKSGSIDASILRLPDGNPVPQYGIHPPRALDFRLNWLILFGPHRGYLTCGDGKTESVETRQLQMGYPTCGLRF